MITAERRLKILEDLMVYLLRDRLSNIPHGKMPDEQQIRSGAGRLAKMINIPVDEILEAVRPAVERVTKELLQQRQDEVQKINKAFIIKN
jgi:hypothetical protein